MRSQHVVGAARWRVSSEVQRCTKPERASALLTAGLGSERMQSGREREGVEEPEYRSGRRETGARARAREGERERGRRRGNRCDDDGQRLNAKWQTDSQW